MFYNSPSSCSFVWDKRGQQWRDNYDKLREFKLTHGHCNATASHNGGDKALGSWVTKQKTKYIMWKRGETKSLELSLTDEQAALMDEIGFGESVEVDGRKLRPSRKGRPKKCSSHRPRTIAGLVNASAEIEGKTDNLHQPARHLDAGVGSVERAVDENTNDLDSASAVANSWGDSANAVSLLVDAIMNKESHPATSGLQGIIES